MTSELKRFHDIQEVFVYVQRPEVQRNIDKTHVADLREYIKSSYDTKEEPILGVIDLCKCPDLPNKLFVIDGQHRLQAYAEEFKETKRPIAVNTIIYTVPNAEAIANAFRLRNKNCPVPDYIIKAQQSNSVRSLLKEIEAYVSTLKLFNKYIKRPNVNITQFMNALAQCAFKKSIKTIEQFKKAFDQVNDRLKQQSSLGSYRKSQTISACMLQKCKQAGIYIGLDKNFMWMDSSF